MKISEDEFADLVFDNLEIYPDEDENGNVSWTFDRSQIDRLYEAIQELDRVEFELVIDPPHKLFGDNK